MVSIAQPPYHQLVDWQCPGIYPSQAWYYWALPEGQLFGQMFVYGSGNDADAMLVSARCVQILLALTVGVLIYWWVRYTASNPLAAVVALSAWVFNPNALAYGHLASTGDIGVTLGITAALFLFARLLQNPTATNAAVCGLATGVALTMKFTAITLVPMFLILTAMSWKRVARPARNLRKYGAIVLGVTWLVLLIVYFPRWRPAPVLADQQADALAVPNWFTGFRLFLIPADFFKGLALAIGHSKGGHDAYLMGDWSHDGWWYYYPLAFFLKNSVSFVVLTLIGAIVFIRAWRRTLASPLEFVPWIASIVYMLVAMTSKVNIGVRHLLPIFPLCCVGIGNAVARWSRPLARKCAYGLVSWQALIVLYACPLYLQFFSEAIGGPANGYKYLIDSNYDWGQDANRLKQFLADRGITHIYLKYFGTQFNIEYLKIPNTRVEAEQAQQLKDGWLVVSASELMRPEWSWLRESRQPTARVAYTLFVYHLGG